MSTPFTIDVELERKHINVTDREAEFMETFMNRFLSRFASAHCELEEDNAEIETIRKNFTGDGIPSTQGGLSCLLFSDYSRALSFRVPDSVDDVRRERELDAEEEFRYEWNEKKWREEDEEEEDEDDSEEEEDSEDEDVYDEEQFYDQLPEYTKNYLEGWSWSYGFRLWKDGEGFVFDACVLLDGAAGYEGAVTGDFCQEFMHVENLSGKEIRNLADRTFEALEKVIWDW